MALHRCPECRKKISESVQACPEIYCQNLEQRRKINQEINQQNNKLQLVWLLIFAVVIGVASWWVNQ